MSRDGYMPHKFPKLSGNDSYGDLISWECQACGEWIKEYGKQEKTNCTIDWRELKMGKREKVMKEPPLGSVVIDKTGSAWQRGTLGWSNSGSDGSWAYTWERVLKEELYLELDNPTLQWESVLTDPRLPCIVYIPNEELIWEKEEE